jgi:hypothetical protein
MLIGKNVATKHVLATFRELQFKSHNEFDVRKFQIERHTNFYQYLLHLLNFNARYFLVKNSPLVVKEENKIRLLT